MSQKKVTRSVDSSNTNFPITIILGKLYLLLSL